MLKTLKRKIALVAVAALGSAGLAVVAAPVANAAGGTAVTAISSTAPAVRVSYTSTTLDAVGLVPLTITNAATYGVGTIVGGDQATITLTSAPSAAAKLVVAATAAAGQAGSGAADFTVNTLNGRVLTLAAATKSIEGVAVVTATGGTSKIWIAADTVGTYSGTILLDNAVGGGQQETATFSFTTTGAPASITLDSTAQSVPAGGRSQWNATVKDANGNATILGIYDSIGVTCSTACTAAAGQVNSLVDSVATGNGNAVTSITAARIAAGSGTAGVNHRASGVAGASTTISFKALGVISALGTQTATVTETAQTIDTSLIIATPTITTTPDASAITGANTGGNGWVRNATIKAGTSAVTFGFTAPTAGLGKEFRFAINASAGTVDGTAYTTTVYKTAVADATTGKGSISFTLGGAALLVNATVTVKQVNVVNVAVAPADNAAGQVNATLGDIRGILVTLTQTAADFDGDGITPSPANSIVAKLGASTEVSVSLTNTFAEALGAGYLVRVYRGTSNAGTLLDAKPTDATGTAKVTVTNAATLTAAGSETYHFEVQPPTGVAVQGTAATRLTINYTTTGAVTTMSLAITNAGDTPTTPITNATLSSSITRIPIVYVPSDGYANTSAERSRVLATASTAAADSGVATVTASGAGEYFTLVASPSAATPVTWTGTDGVRFCSSTSASPTATSCAWDAGKTTVTAASTNFIHVYSIKTGTQTVTAAVGDVKATMSFVARNRVIDGYNIILTPATQTLDSGAYGTVNVKVTDIFGNAVAAAAGDVTVSVTGPALLSGLAASASPATSATAGSEGANLTIIASTTGSGDATVAGAPGAATAATAWATTYVKPTNAPDPVKAASAKVTVKAAAASAAQTAETTAIKADVKAVSDTVATLSKAVTTIQSSVTELTTSFTAQIKSLSSAIAKISRAIAALSKRIK